MKEAKGIHCPRCGHNKVKKTTTGEADYYCNYCNNYFTKETYKKWISKFKKKGFKK